MVKLNKTDKIEDGKKVGEHYTAVVIIDQDGSAMIYDSSVVNWRDLTACATSSITEIIIPIHTK